MKLLTKEIEARFAKLGRQDGKGFAAEVVAKFFRPLSSWRWYATEYDPKHREFFGFVVGDAAEWGPFSLDEFEAIGRRSGLPMERDLYRPAGITLRAALIRDGNGHHVYP